MRLRKVLDQMSRPKEEIDAARERNRQAMPETAKVIDEFREHFGPGVKVLWAEENGRTVGNESKN